MVCVFVISVLLTSAAAAYAQALPEARVAVLAQPGMVVYGGAPAIQPANLAGHLSAWGLPTVSLSAAQIANPEVFNAERFAAVVLPYGNAFPLPAYAGLRAFHRDGGCLVMTGVPFCHPCVSDAPVGWEARWSTAAQWLEEGHSGLRAVRVRHRGIDWEGCTQARRWPVKPGETLRIGGWVRSRGSEADRDRLFVRFFAGGAFVGQDGPAVPPDATEWRWIDKVVTVPEGAGLADVSLQVWSFDATVDLDDVVVTRLGSDANLAVNPGFEEAGGEWRDLGHSDDYFGHNVKGIGTGAFDGPPDTEAPLTVVDGNPLGLEARHLARPSARLQWLAAQTLAPEDEVLPVVTLDIPQGHPVPAAAAIRHNCPDFRGARDVWVGQVADGYSPEDRYAAEQMIARGVAWCLMEKKVLSEDAYRQILARLLAESKPAPLPDQIDIVDEPRPWGDTFFPKSKPPARELLVVDVRRLGAWERLALTCLQGLTARQRPVLWLFFSDWDRIWLDWHREKGHIDSYRVVDDWRGLFRQFGTVVKGAVVPDDGQYQGVLLACNVAACEDLIVAPEGLARELGLEVKADLRGCFPTYAESLQWLWKTYSGQLNHHLCIYAHPNTAFMGTLGYDMQWRGLIFWVSGEKDGSEPGADSLSERQVMAQIFASLPPNIGMRGFPWAGEGIGLGEGGGVEFCGGYGKGLVCTDHTPNLAVMSGVQIDSLTPPPQPATPLLEADKVYVALTMSDGDNLNTFYDYFRPYFEHSSHGRFPIGWGMGPTILDLMPAVAQWYYEHAQPGDEFLADVSGIAYVFPQTYAERYRDRAKVLAGFLDWTARYMKRLGMATGRPHGGDNDRLSAYAEAIPFMHSIFADYAYAERGYEESVYTLPGGMPVFRALTSWRHGSGGLLREIRDVVGQRRPAFVNAFVHNWTFRMEHLQAAVNGRDADMVFVTPAQLAQLYRKAKQEGIVK